MFENNFKAGEEFAHLEVHKYKSPQSFFKSSIQIGVSCVKIHPQADLNDTLANNIAVMKLDVPNPPPSNPSPDPGTTTSRVISLVTLKEAPMSPATEPDLLSTGEC